MLDSTLPQSMDCIGGEGDGSNHANNEPVSAKPLR